MEGPQPASTALSSQIHKRDLFVFCSAALVLQMAFLGARTSDLGNRLFTEIGLNRYFRGLLVLGGAFAIARVFHRSEHYRAFDGIWSEGPLAPQTEVLGPFAEMVREVKGGKAGGKVAVNLAKATGYVFASSEEAGLEAKALAAKTKRPLITVQGYASVDDIKQAYLAASRNHPSVFFVDDWEDKGSDVGNRLLENILRATKNNSVTVFIFSCDRLHSSLLPYVIEDPEAAKLPRLEPSPQVPSPFVKVYSQPTMPPPKMLPDLWDTLKEKEKNCYFPVNDQVMLLAKAFSAEKKRSLVVVDGFVSPIYLMNAYGHAQAKGPSVLLIQQWEEEEAVEDPGRLKALRGVLRSAAKDNVLVFISAEELLSPIKDYFGEQLKMLGVWS